MSSLRARSLLMVGLAAFVLAGAARGSSILVVDMIPYSMSDETNEDSEPYLAVNPANPKQMAATAFTPDPMQGLYAPIFISTDGGLSWYINPIVHADSDHKTDDITVRFSGSGNRLYAAELTGSFAPAYWMLRTTDFTQPTVMDTLQQDSNIDQPWLATATVIGPQDTGKDRLYVGMNDHNGLDGHTATVRRAADGAVAAPQFDSLRLEERGTAGTDLAPVRIATHPDGTVYAIYIGVQGYDIEPENQTLDAVVARDDNWAVGAELFKALKGGDTKAGHVLAHQITVPIDAMVPKLGSERLGGGGLSIAVDPNDSSRVYAVYSDYPGGNPPYTLHVLRSDNRGVDWTKNDLLTVQNAINPALAVNSVGTVGLLYQQLTAANHWETHFRRSLNLGAGWFDVLLATFTDGMPAMVDLPYLGDYAHLQAVGQDFYGVFSSANFPDLAHLPSGFSFLRKVDPNTHTLRNQADTQTVPVSIDPFFFHFSDQVAGDDFYVRDWTASPASGDNGVQPSTNPVFYQTSDVWNRRSLDPGMFPNDQPDNQDAGNGDLLKGDNWAFTRVRRNVGGAAATVTAHFLVAKFGVGSPYVDSTQPDADASFPDTDPQLSFAAGETAAKTSVPYHWHLNQVASKHLCLAVEIKTPLDPYIGKSLRGSAPGWPTDLKILNDNNRAQRNMFLSNTPAMPQPPQPGMKKRYYAILHNAATFTRDMTLQYTLSDPRRLAGATARVVASSLGPLPAGDPWRLTARGSLVVQGMQPEEDRWLEIGLPAPAGGEGDEVDVDFQEVAADQVLDGFAVGARRAAPPQVIAEVLESQRSVHTRLAALYPSDFAAYEVKAAQSALATGAFGEGIYLRFLGANLKVMASALDPLSRSLDGGDPFGTRAELDGLARLYTSGAPTASLLLAHAAYLEELDSLLTLRRLQKGDSADILQNVRWQRDLFVRADRLTALPLAGAIVDASRSFVDGYGERRLNDPDFPIFLRGLFASLRRVAGELEPVLPGLTAREQAVEDAVATGDLTAMQKTHRDFLAQLAALDSVQ